jgi:hypothetical protein
MKNINYLKVGDTAGGHPEAVASDFTSSKPPREICAFVNTEKLLDSLNN